MVHYPIVYNAWYYMSDTLLYFFNLFLNISLCKNPIFFQSAESVLYFYSLLRMTLIVLFLRSLYKCCKFLFFLCGIWMTIELGNPFLYQGIQQGQLHYNNFLWSDRMIVFINIVVIASLLPFSWFALWMINPHDC